MIKLFVCCHKPSVVPDHPLLVPIQVGTALAEDRFPGFFHDNVGDNISDKNAAYCELTAQYWAWKNDDSEYVGFFHYRRYLYPDTRAKRPYIIEHEPSLACLDKLDYMDFPELIEAYDLILPMAENMYVPVREHYANAPFHHQKDLELVAQIIRERVPDYSNAMETYFSGSISYFGNIYIMRRPIFEDYCHWLFPILGEFDRRMDRSGYGEQDLRVDGYLAERLLGIYVTYHRQFQSLHSLELPRVHFEGARSLDALTQQVLYHTLPPGTRRRAILKGVIQPWKGPIVDGTFSIGHNTGL